MYIPTEVRNSEHPWKIMQLIWTVVITYLLKNIKHAIEHDIDSAYGVWMH